MNSKHLFIVAIMLWGIDGCNSVKQKQTEQKVVAEIHNEPANKAQVKKMDIPSTVQWTDIETAQGLIKLDGNRNKIIFVDCYTDWCGWCKVMDNKTFSDTLIAKFMNYYFISVKFNAEQRGDVAFNGVTYKYQQQGNRGVNMLAYVLQQNKLSYPSFVFLNADLTHKDMIAGYVEKGEFEPIIVYLGEKYDSQMSYEQFKSQYPTEIRPKILEKIL